MIVETKLMCPDNGLESCTAEDGTNFADILYGTDWTRIAFPPSGPGAAAIEYGPYPPVSWPLEAYIDSNHSHIDVLFSDCTAVRLPIERPSWLPGAVLKTLKVLYDAAPRKIAVENFLCDEGFGANIGMNKLVSSLSMMLANIGFRVELAYSSSASTTCPNCGMKLRRSGRKAYCPYCGLKDEPESMLARYLWGCPEGAAFSEEGDVYEFAEVAKLLLEEYELAKSNRSWAFKYVPTHYVFVVLFKDDDIAMHFEKYVPVISVYIPRIGISSATFAAVMVALKELLR